MILPIPEWWSWCGDGPDDEAGATHDDWASVVASRCAATTVRQRPVGVTPAASILSWANTLHRSRGAGS